MKQKSLKQRALHWWRGCMAHEMVDSWAPLYGVLDVTYRCQCGREWTTTFRTYNVRLADWFWGSARRRV